MVSLSMFNFFDAAVGVILAMFAYLGFSTGIIASIFYIISGYILINYSGCYQAKLGMYFYGVLIISIAVILFIGHFFGSFFRKFLGPVDKILGIIIGLILGLLVTVFVVFPIAQSKKMPSYVNKVVPDSYSFSRLSSIAQKYFPNVKIIKIEKAEKSVSKISKKVKK